MAEETTAAKGFAIPTPPTVTWKIDYATLIGLIVSFGLVIAVMIMGGRPEAFWDTRSFLVVIAGTFAITMASFSFYEFFSSLKIIGNSLFYISRSIKDSATFTLKLAEISRKQGILSLEKVLPQLKREYYLSHGLRLIVDGTPVNEVERILQQELSSMLQRHQQSVSVLKKAAEVAPAMGLIGTLLGLVQMLGSLNDPSTIGPAMAVALITTFYGAIMANMFFLPLASKLDRNTEEEVLINRIYIIAVGSIGRRENPRRLETMINAAMPPAKRIHFFD